MGLSQRDAGDEHGGGEGVQDLHERIEAAEPAPADPGTIPVDLAALIYTSGSTGRPAASSTNVSVPGIALPTEVGFSCTSSGSR